jgi:dTDP-4-amino-4,6-dideoxygalactose transaminase
VLHSKWLTMGGVTQSFEAEYAAAHGAAHAIAVSNATQALHLACLALGIGPGDEVIVPALTFVATANAVLYTGASVRFADILGPGELTVDPADIEACITPRTKAIIVMHYGGYPCRMPEICQVAGRHGLAVIEDAAHAPGAWLDGRALGTWGEIGCFSFFSNKNLSTGEGGMLLTQRAELAQKLRLLRSHGMTSLTWDRHHGHASSYDVVELGYNDRIDEIHSALGRVQLRKLVANNAHRRDLTDRYWQAFQGSPLELPFRESFTARYRPYHPRAYLPAHHLMPVLLPPGTNRAGVVERMKAAGIQTSLHYPPVHSFCYYQARYPSVDLPRTTEAAAREVSLPLYPTLTVGQVQVVAETLLAALA